jgi:membrane protein
MRTSTPERPTELSRGSWWSVLTGAVREFRADQITDLSAALTYYGILALFPALLVAVSILGLLGQDTSQSLLNNVSEIAPGAVRSFFQTVLDSAQQQHTGASVGVIVGILLALWSASGYVAAFMRASNQVYGVEEGRPIWKTAPIRVGVTLIALVLLLLSAGIVLITGRIAEQVGQAVGIGHAAVTAWSIAKWPVLLVIVALLLALLYWACPNVVSPGLRWITPGGFVAVVIWLLASGGFAVYVANFASYNKTYGTVAGIIVFLVWLWISNIAVLLGLEFDAELDRQRSLAGGESPEVVPRDDPDS